MPHQNVQSSKATAQNGVVDPSSQGNDMARGEQATVRSEARSYAAPDVADATLAPPAAGEMPTFMEEGEALGVDDLQMGSKHTRRPVKTEAEMGQGPKTRAANRQIAKHGRAD